MVTKRMFAIALAGTMVVLLGVGCAVAVPSMKGKTRPFQPISEESVTPAELAKEPIMFRFGHRYGHELKEKRIEDHQIVHEMRELLIDVTPDDLELFRRGFRLGYGGDGFRLFDELWKEAQATGR